jgi:hypothetical protein
MENKPIGWWVDIRDNTPATNGYYLVKIMSRTLSTMAFSLFTDGKFDSPYVTHWGEVLEP